MKKVVFIIFFSLLAGISHGQESETVYNFLRLPSSAHVAALGGDIITLPDDDANMIFHNPALISNVSDKSITLNYMTYMEGCNTASAAFVKAAGNKGTWGVMAHAMIFGPKQVVMVVGMNKVAGTLEGAIDRARHVAAPINAARFAGLGTPCAKLGTCADCLSPDSICCQMVITRLSRVKGRIKVILVGENTGF